MNWIWIMPALLVVTLAGVFFPLFTRGGRRPLPVGLDNDPVVQLQQERDLLLRQIKELDLEGGDDPAQLEARGELSAKLAAVLARLDDGGEAVAGEKTAGVGAGSRAVDVSLGVAAVVVVTTLTAGLYLFMGTPMIVPPRNAPQAQGYPDEVRGMVARLAERLRGEPDNLTDWLQLARSQVVLEMPQEAMRSYMHILSRDPENIDAAAGLARLQIQSDNPELAAGGLRLYREILAKDPDRPDALWTLGMLSYRAGKKEEALEMWRRLLANLPSDSQARPMVEKAIRDAEGK